MRLLSSLAVFVVAILATQVRATAEESSVPPEELSTVSAQSCPADDYTTNGFDQYRRTADLGGPHSAGYGFKHFALPFQNYTNWHRPKASTLTRAQRCEPDEFRPRGYGNLFAKPCDSFRMEYAPFVLNERSSQYGPAYIVRGPDHRCEDCK